MKKRKFKRWLVLGCGGSGKSTFAVKLAKALGLKLHHLDSLYWKPGWNPTPKKEWEKTVARLIRQKEWIIDGSYYGTLDQRLKRADTAVFFDLPRGICLWRVLKRRVQNLGGRNRLGMPEGCPERVYGTFLKWIWTYRKTQRPLVLKKLQKFAGRGKVFAVTRSEQADELLAKWG